MGNINPTVGIGTVPTVTTVDNGHRLDPPDDAVAPWTATGTSPTVVTVDLLDGGFDTRPGPTTPGRSSSLFD
jgi:hypothetical protein